MIFALATVTFLDVIVEIVQPVLLPTIRTVTMRGVAPIPRRSALMLIFAVALVINLTSWLVQDLG